jgi:hypothetical protein
MCLGRILASQQCQTHGVWFITRREILFLVRFAAFGYCRTKSGKSHQKRIPFDFPSVYEEKQARKESMCSSNSAAAVGAIWVRRNGENMEKY